MNEYNEFRYMKVGYYRKQKRKEIYDNDVSDIKTTSLL